MSFDLKEIVKQLRRGDKLAFNALFEEYGRRLYAFAYKYLKSEEEAEDLVQNVFLIIWRNRERLDVNKSFHAYIFTIAFNEIRSHFRKKIVTVELGDLKESYGAKTTNEDIAYNAAMANIVSLLKKLPERQREIFELSRFEHLTADEISTKLNISTKTVYNQISKTIGYLRENLEENIGIVLFMALFIL